MRTHTVINQWFLIIRLPCKRSVESSHSAPDVAEPPGIVHPLGISTHCKVLGNNASPCAFTASQWNLCETRHMTQFCPPTQMPSLRRLTRLTFSTCDTEFGLLRIGMLRGPVQFPKAETSKHVESADFWRPRSSQCRTIGQNNVANPCLLRSYPYYSWKPKRL